MVVQLPGWWSRRAHKLWFSTVAVPVSSFTCPLLGTTSFAVVPQLPFIAGRRHPGHGADAGSNGSPCSEDHRDSPVAVLDAWWSMSLFAACADSSLLSV